MFTEMENRAGVLNELQERKPFETSTRRTNGMLQ